MQQASKYVNENGHLDTSTIVKQETLYKGMNGRVVERFYARDGNSYIFKPLTNPKQVGRERWMYETVLPHLSVSSPQLIAASHESERDQSWLILEDLGSISHSYAVDILLEMAAHCANWHHFLIEEPLRLSPQGPKPSIEQIKKELFSQTEREAFLILDRLDPKIKGVIKNTLKQVADFSFEAGLVFSHGDLHLGNFGLANNKVVVFDWEYAHLNLPYWDLYHLIEPSHPNFPKRVTPEVREGVLKAYIEKSLTLGREFDADEFTQEYVAFSTLFSCWMLQLIEKDLIAKNPIWSKSQLLEQKQETLSSLIQCVERFNEMKKSPLL